MMHPFSLKGCMWEISVMDEGLPRIDLLRRLAGIGFGYNHEGCDVDAPFRARHAISRPR